MMCPPPYHQPPQTADILEGRTHTPPHHLPYSRPYSLHSSLLYRFAIYQPNYVHPTIWYIRTVIVYVYIKFKKHGTVYTRLKYKGECFSILTHTTQSK